MRPEEKVEMVLIPLVAAGVWLLAPLLPARIGAGNLVLVCSGTLLLQSLVRDLVLLVRARREGKHEAGPAVRCMCVESVLGVTGVLAGAAALGAGLSQVVPMGAAAWALVVATVTSAGFAIKDLVFEWNPWRLRRDKDHMNIVFTLKRGKSRAAPEGPEQREEAS